MEEIKIFSGNSNVTLAEKIALEAGTSLGEAKIGRFSDGESRVEIDDNVRGQDVFLVQSACPPVNDNYMELFLMIDAVRRASAKSITAVIPYYGYARQDRKEASRTPISAKCVADLITSAGATRVVSVDLHASQIQGFFNCPVDHLFATPTIARCWLDEYGSGEEFVTVSPDAGGVERARAFAKRIKSSLAIIDKRRTSPNKAEAMHVVGDVEGKTAIVLDDMIDTAGTLIQAVDSLLKFKAKQVFAVCSHPVLSGPALSRLKESPIKEIWVTDTIPLGETKGACNKIKVVSIAPLMAEAIKRIHGNQSVSSLFT